MVLYYSATGNTEFIAKELARRTDDECVDLLNRIRKQDYTPIHSDKPFIICAPIYVCEIPRFMMQYLKKVSFTGNQNVYFMLTSGGYSGPAGVLMKKLFEDKKMTYRGYAEFIMPRNYVVSDSYPMLEREKIEERILGSYKKLDKVAQGILDGKTLIAKRVRFFETLVTVPLNPFWCKFRMPAKDFFTEDSCNGCGKCERLCPLNNINLVDGKPVWGKECTHCMACISNCPTDSIEYGTITQKKEPYNFGKYKYVVENLEK